MHLLPRWTGDPISDGHRETRVLPQDLFTTYDKLAPYFARAVDAPLSTEHRGPMAR